MRILTSVLLSLAIFLGASSIALAAQTSEKHQQISRILVAEANAVLSTEAEAARSLFERALVADPSNIQAMIGIAKSYDQTDRIGRSLKYYRQALELEPNDTVALSLQALAFLKKDMLDKAEDNKGKLALICPEGCKALDDTETAIEAYMFEQDKKAETKSETDKSDPKG